MAETYELYYWPPLPGRGEYIRLIFEDTGTPYADVGRLPVDQGGGMDAILAYYKGERPGLPAFAPPVLKAGELVLAQMPSICLFLGRRLGRCPADEAGWLQANQLQLTLADLVDEVHDTHHPLGVSLYYEDQQAAAKQRSATFLQQRLPKFISYFSRVLAHNGGAVLVGDTVSYVDLALFQTLEGIAYAFPRAFARQAEQASELIALRDRVAARPRLATYLASERRLPFNEDGIFRHYPELDLDD
jgi:glutathione S-transferase